MNKKLLILVLLIFAIAIAWTTHGAIHFSGPYRMVAYAQLKLANGYAPIMTFVLTFGVVALAILLPFATIIVSVRLIFFPTKEKDPSTRPTVSTAEALAKVDKLRFRMNANYYAIVAIGVATVSFVMGAYWLIQGITAGPLTQVTLEDLYRPDYVPPSHYVRVSEGELLWEDRVRVREQRRGTFFYIPLQASGNEANKDTRVVMRVDERETLRLFKITPPFTGILSQPLDGFVRDLFEQNSFPISQNAWELDVAESPGKLKGMGILMILVGSLAGGFFAWRKRRKKPLHQSP